eukprot:1191631-Prorocentrum_minimum.AAC.2
MSLQSAFRLQNSFGLRKCSCSTLSNRASSVPIRGRANRTTGASVGRLFYRPQANAGDGISDSQGNGGKDDGNRLQRTKLPNEWELTFVSEPDVPFLYHEVRRVERFSHGRYVTFRPLGNSYAVLLSNNRCSARPSAYVAEGSSCHMRFSINLT